ncbi:MAG: DUF6438 domain-containing protein [Saprospiraceae bacterium]
MKSLQWLALLAVAYISMASTCRPLTSQDFSKMKPRIEMQKGACFGSCPVYKLTIYQGGIAAYEGQRFTERVGLHTKKLSSEAYKTLIAAFQEAEMWSFQNTYKAEVPDLPTVTITYYEGDQVKSVKGKDGRPTKIIELEKMLTAIADSGGWERQSGEGNSYGVEDGVIANELIVNLSPEVDASVWVIQFAKQDMQIVKRISPESPYWLFRYNPNTVAPTEMLETVRRDPYVLSAEFNRQLNIAPRN